MQSRRWPPEPTGTSYAVVKGSTQARGLVSVLRNSRDADGAGEAFGAVVAVPLGFLCRQVLQVVILGVSYGRGCLEVKLVRRCDRLAEGMLLRQL